MSLAVICNWFTAFAFRAIICVLSGTGGHTRFWYTVQEVFFVCLFYKNQACQILSLLIKQNHIDWVKVEQSSWGLTYYLISDYKLLLFNKNLKDGLKLRKQLCTCPSLGMYKIIWIWIQLFPSVECKGKSGKTVCVVKCPFLWPWSPCKIQIQCCVFLSSWDHTKPTFLQQ